MARGEIRRVKLSDLKTGPQRHEQFPPELTERIRALWAWAQPFVGRSFKDWVQGFMHDADPEREVAIWEAIGAGTAEVAELPWPQRQAWYLFLVAQSMGQPFDEIVEPLAASMADFTDDLDTFHEIQERVRIGYKSKWDQLGGSA